MPARTTKPYRELVTIEDRDRWLGERRRGIGASEVAAILGESPWSSPMAVYAAKVHGVEQDLGIDTEVRLLMEPVILELYRRRTGREARPGGVLLQSTEHAWALCTLDADHEAEELGPLELKAESIYGADRWADGPPRQYWWQVHAQMLVTGAPKGSIAALIGHQFVWCDVERNEAAIAHMVQVCADFWLRVERREPPSPDDHRATRAALEAIYSSETKGKVVALGHDLIDVADELTSLKAQRAEIKRQVERLELDVKAQLQDAEAGVLPDGSTFTWRSQTRRAHHVAESTFRVLRFSAAKER